MMITKDKRKYRKCLGVGLLLKTEEIFVVSGTKRKDKRQEIIRY